MKNMVKTKNKSIIAAVLVCMVLLSGVIVVKLLDVSFAKNKVKLYDEFKSGNGRYEVTDENNLFVKYLYPVKDATTLTIPDTVKYKGETLKVVSIKQNSLQGNKKIKKITIGSKVVFIDKKAFYGCKNLKDITIKASNLTKSGVKANAFKGINSKAVIKVPEQKLSEYKKILNTRGVTGKNQVIKGMEIEEEVPEITFGPDHPLPKPEEAIASIGDIAKIGTDNFCKAKVSDSVKYSTGDSITFSARICMHPDIYGTLDTRESYGIWSQCYVCGRKFSSDKSHAIHLSMTTDGCYYRYIFPEEKEVYTEHYWIPDNAPCKTTFRFTLPKGLSCQKDNIQLLYSKDIEIDSSAYQVETSGQDIIVTIDDIKKEPFFGYDFQGTSAFRAPISVLINAEMNDDTAAVNTASASVSYSYKGLEKTIDLGTMSVYAASLQLKNTDAEGNAIDGSKFTLYKQKIVYNELNIGAPQYFEIADGTCTDGMLDFKGLGEGKYKLVQAEAPAGTKKMDSMVFNVDLTGKDGSITSIGVTDKSGKKLPWDTNIKTGVINATVNQ